MKRRLIGAVAAVAIGLAMIAAPALAQTKVLKMQATWPASLTLYDNFTFFAFKSIPES